MAFQVLNKLKFTDRLAQAHVTFTDRGSPGDQGSFMGCDITSLAKDHLTFRNERGKETFLPLHRILEVRIGTTVLWKKRA